MKNCTMQQHIFFSFTDSRAHIHESPDLHVQTGSRLVLACYVLESSAPPDYIYWYRNNNVLNYSPLVNIQDVDHRKETTRYSAFDVACILK